MLWKTVWRFTLKLKRELSWTGGTADRNPPASAEDAGLILGPGRFHVPQSNESPCSTTTEPICSNYEACALEPVLHKRNHLSEKPVHCNEE